MDNVDITITMLMEKALSTKFSFLYNVREILEESLKVLMIMKSDNIFENYG